MGFSLQFPRQILNTRFRPNVDFLVNGKPTLASRQNFIFGVITTSTTGNDDDDSDDDDSDDDNDE